MQTCENRTVGGFAAMELALLKDPPSTIPNPKSMFLSLSLFLSVSLSLYLYLSLSLYLFLPYGCKPVTSPKLVVESLWSNLPTQQETKSLAGTQTTPNARQHVNNFHLLPNNNNNNKGTRTSSDKMERPENCQNVATVGMCHCGLPWHVPHDWCGPGHRFFPILQGYCF